VKSSLALLTYLDGRAGGRYTYPDLLPAILIQPIVNYMRAAPHAAFVLPHAFNIRCRRALVGYKRNYLLPRRVQTRISHPAFTWRRLLPTVHTGHASVPHARISRCHHSSTIPALTPPRALPSFCRGRRALPLAVLPAFCWQRLLFAVCDYRCSIHYLSTTPVGTRSTLLVAAAAFSPTALPLLHTTDVPDVNSALTDS